MTNDPPKVFISYSHDDQSHKDWVLNFATELRKHGVDAILDQWDLYSGSNLQTFMEKGLSGADRVLVICTDNYIQKANSGIGGVGYEKLILTQEIIGDQETTKFIPIVRNVSGPNKTPTSLFGRMYKDFSDGSKFDEEFGNLLHDIHNVPITRKPKLGANPFQTTNTYSGPSSTVLFDERFRQAFPGLRGLKWFRDPPEAVKRLSLLLKTPLIIESLQPFWWWGQGDMSITEFEQINTNTVLMNHEELEIEAIAAANSQSYYRSFVYVQTKPSNPTGIYRGEPLGSREAYGLYKGNIVKYEELQDGGAEIDGEIVRFEEPAELRIRHLEPYNFIIAANNSPINNTAFDDARMIWLREILTNNEKLEDFIDVLKKLPKRDE